MLGEYRTKPPLGADPPREQADTLPGSRHPPGADPPGADTPPKQTPPDIRSLLRTVRILLECILVCPLKVTPNKMLVWNLCLELYHMEAQIALKKDS